MLLAPIIRHLSLSYLKFNHLENEKARQVYSRRAKEDCMKKLYPRTGWSYA